MRDIRSDLMDRLKALSAERTRLQVDLDELKHREILLRALLEDEEDYWSKSQPSLFEVAAEGNGEPERTEVSRFLLEALSDAGEHSLSDLKELAENAGVDFGEKSPGRVLHFALLGMAQNELVEMVSKGVWRRKRREERAPS